MENFSGITGKLLLKKRVVLKIVNKELTDKKRRDDHTVPVTVLTTITGYHVAG